MKINEYEISIAKFDLYDDQIKKLFTDLPKEDLIKTMSILVHYAGLAGESGELGEKIKKSIRDNGKIELRDPLIGKELGDVYWYLTRLSSAFGFSAEEILQLNYEKLSDRFNRDKIRGNGDNR